MDGFLLFCKFFQLLIKSRIRDIHAVRINDLSLPVRSEGSYGEGHGDAVILVTVDDGTMERLSAVDDHAALSLLHIGAHGAQVFDHDGDTVGFFDF